MRHKHLLKKIALIVICTCTTAIFSVAQQRVIKNSAKAKSPLPYEDSLLKGNVNLPLNITVAPNATTASTQTIYTPDLIKHPVANVLNTLTGQLAGLYTLQSSGQPGADGVSLTLRGRTPIILIDGIPRSLTSMDLEEVESVTVLKDAMATAMLGVRGANGAILITTRHGSVTAPEISFTVQSAFQQPLGILKPLNAFDYATLRNEAVKNELSVNPNFSTGLLYTSADLDAFKNHTDPIGHPDVDWSNQILKSRTQLNRYTLTMSGGNNAVRYFTTVEHLYQDGLFKTSDINTYNTNEYFSRYLIRSNVDVNVTKNVTAGIHLLGSIANENQPGVTTATLFSSLLTTPSTAYNIYNTNGSYGGNTLFTNNIQGQVISSGYQQNYTRNVLADFYVKRTLDEITPGMYAKASVSYTSTVNENINRSKPVIAYQQTGTGAGATYGAALTPASSQINTNTISGTTGLPGVGQYIQNYIELATGWNRTFDNTHGFDVELLANSDSKSDGALLAYTVQGISAHASYNYKQKYVVEFAGAYNGSNYYPTGNHFKYGFLPVGGLAWYITKEDFMKSQTWLSTLKLAANYGRTGNDNPGYFAYLQRYNNGSNVYFGTSAGSTNGLQEGGPLANPNITFEKADKLNISLQGALLKDRLGFTIDYYNNKFSDVLIQRGQNTSLIGNSYPNENIGRNRYTGFDFQISWQQRNVNGIGYYVMLNAGFQQSKILYSNEVAQPYSYMQHTGQKTDQQFGYVAAGLFQSQQDINNAKANGVGVVTGYTPQPGDIKYIDQNKDGTINQFDQVPIGPKGPLITYGANVGFSYKSFDISALLQGVSNYNVYLNGNSYWEFQNNGYGQAYQQQLGRFTPATAATATYPRLSIGTNSNNQSLSTYWYRKADFMRLKNLQIGFTLPVKYANAIKLKSLRIFAGGTNLFTVTSLKGGLDPEDYNGLYPIQKLYNLGINIKL